MLHSIGCYLVIVFLQVKALCKVVPRQIKAEKAVDVIRDTVEELIAKCKEIVEAEGEKIDNEEYVNDADPSILRFLLASREEVRMLHFQASFILFALSFAYHIEIQSTRERRAVILQIYTPISLCLYVLSMNP